MTLRGPLRLAFVGMSLTFAACTPSSNAPATLGANSAPGSGGSASTGDDAGGSTSTTDAGSGSTTTRADASTPTTLPSPGAALLSDSYTLTSLTLSGFNLSPSFSPTVHDYVVQCEAGTNTTTITATATDGASVSLTQPQATSLAQPATITMAENDAVVVEATAEDGVPNDYWVRCLPHDFPQLTFTRYGSTTPGYYVLGNSTIETGEAGYAMVLDQNATPIWYRAVDPATTAGYVTVIAQDTIVYMSLEGGRFGTDPLGHFVIANLDTGVETSVATVGVPTDEHEFKSLANGDFMMLSYPQTSGIDLSSRGITDTTTIADCNIQEVAPDGSLVWSWLGSDHIDAVTESTELALATIGDTSVVDPFHCNSIDVTLDGDVLLSARQIDAVMLISRATGTIQWKLGGIPSNKDGATIIQMQNDPETSFYHQHDARLLPNGDISLYDDHTTQFDTQLPTTDVARGMEIAFNPSTGIATMVWQFQSTIASQATGSFRRYADGSNLIGWGFMSPTSPALAMTEVDDSGNRLLDLNFTLGDYLYRAEKISTSLLSLDVLRKTAGTQ
jgi:hypothetical protein